jgi:hypothetical protein
MSQHSAFWAVLGRSRVRRWRAKETDSNHRMSQRVVEMWVIGFRKSSLSGDSEPLSMPLSYSSVILESVETTLATCWEWRGLCMMCFPCSHLFHDISQVLLMRLAAHRGLELRCSFLTWERVHACWACSQWRDCLPSRKLNHPIWSWSSRRAAQIWGEMGRNIGCSPWCHWCTSLRKAQYFNTWIGVSRFCPHGKEKQSTGPFKTESEDLRIEELVRYLHYVDRREDIYYGPSPYVAPWPSLLNISQKHVYLTIPFSRKVK